MDIEAQKLVVNGPLHRLELGAEGKIAFIEYKLLAKTLFLIHTEVPDELEGKGIGSAIVQKALQFAKDNKYHIVPVCPFVQSYLKRHKEWDEMVAPNAERFIQRQ